MKYDKLYKYLDVNGALAMIKNKTLQFTNPKCFNDPFDCHPGLLDYEVPEDYHLACATKDFIANKAKVDSQNINGRVWVCSLSKRRDSMLMWSYYAGSHKGVCIGLKNDLMVSRFCEHASLGFMFHPNMEVRYTDIIERPCAFNSSTDRYTYQLCTKSTQWQHEQEVRHIIYNPHPWIRCGLPRPTNESEVTPWTAVRFYPSLTEDCFDAIYLGINISDSDKLKVLKAVKENLPGVPVFRMKLDIDRFAFIEELVDVDKYLEEHKEPRLKELWLKIVAKIPFRIKISIIRTRQRKVRRHFLL